MDAIVKAGLLVIRDGRLLLCRKNRDTNLLILPGGRIEPHESDIDCLHREITEELGTLVEVTHLSYVGTYRDEAAGHPGQVVEVRLYQGNLNGTPQPCSEIAGLVWFHPADDPSELSPSLRNKILPDLQSRGYL